MGCGTKCKHLATALGGEALHEGSRSNAGPATHPPAVGPCPASTAQRSLQSVLCPHMPSLAHTWPIPVPSLLLVLLPETPSLCPPLTPGEPPFLPEGLPRWVRGLNPITPSSTLIPAVNLPLNTYGAGDAQTPQHLPRGWACRSHSGKVCPIEPNGGYGSSPWASVSTPVERGSQQVLCPLPSQHQTEPTETRGLYRLTSSE